MQARNAACRKPWRLFDDDCTMTEHEVIVIPTGFFLCDDRSKKLGFRAPEIYGCKFKKCFYTPPTPPLKLTFYGARWVQRATLPWYIGLIPFPNECCRPESSILLQTALKRASDKGNGKDLVRSV